MSLISLYFLRLAFPNTQNLVYQLVIASVFPYILILAYNIRSKNLIRHSEANHKYLIGILVTFLIFTYSFLNIERSRSFQVLRSIGLNEANNNSKLSELPVLNLNHEQRSITAIEKRINEQIKNGNVICSNKKINLTRSGKIIEKISSLIATYYKLWGYFEVDTPLSGKKSNKEIENCENFE